MWCGGDKYKTQLSQVEGVKDPSTLRQAQGKTSSGLEVKGVRGVKDRSDRSDRNIGVTDNKLLMQTTANYRLNSSHY